jgi:DNA-binding IclR family transcriptional regulator
VACHAGPGSAIRLTRVLYPLLAGAAGEGLDRTALGQASKYPPPRVSEAIRRLSSDRYVHQTRDRRYHITGSGERFLAEQAAAQEETAGPLPRWS